MIVLLADSRSTHNTDAHNEARPERSGKGALHPPEVSSTHNTKYTPTGHDKFTGRIRDKTNAKLLIFNVYSWGLVGWENGEETSTLAYILALNCFALH